MLMLLFIFVIICGIELVQVFVVCLYWYWPWRSNYQDGWGPIYRFNPAICVCLSKARVLIAASYILILFHVQCVEMRCDCPFCWYWNFDHHV